MARRILSPKHDQHTRDKIQTSQLVNRLQAFVLDGVDPKTKKPIEISAVQANVALGLLRKTLPDLSATELSGETVQRTITDKPMAEDEWQDTYGNRLASTNGAAKSTH